MSEQSAPTVEEGKVVSFHYVLKNEAGDVLDQSKDEPLAYLHGAGNIVPGLESSLAGRTEGENVKVKIAPQDGYGERNDAAVHQAPRSAFPEGVDVKAGMQFAAEGGEGQVMPVWVTGVEGDQVHLDFNHPLAGKTLHFDVTIAGIRDATDEEREHGHPHGPGGHQH